MMTMIAMLTISKMMIKMIGIITHTKIVTAAMT